MDTPQRRLILAFILMGAVFGVSQWWYARNRPDPPPVAPADSTAAVGDSAAVTPGDTTNLVDADTTPTPVGVADSVSAPPPMATPPVVVETPLYRATIDPLGGTIRQVELLRYPSFTDSTAVALVPRGGAFLQRVAELEGGTLTLSELPFAASEVAIRLAEGDSARTLVLTWEGNDPEGNGQRVVQRYRFDPSIYAIDYRLELGSGEGVLHTTLGPRLESNEKNPREDYGALRAAARVDGEIVTHSAEDAAEGAAEGGGLSYAGAIDWTGLRNKYFLAVLVESDEGPALSAVSFRGVRSDTLPVLEVRATTPIRGGTAAYRVLFAPQEYQRLRAMGHGLDEINQYGWSWIRWMITPFAKLIVVLMLWLHKYIPNYGLVLIVFAVLVRIVLWPLTTKSFRSIQEMQKLQPELQRLREMHKNDPQKMQQETMRLYRERKVNPLGGCLPNLIPMPILFALFFVFQSTIEFRGASFLWLPDLSQADPYYILPILMGLTMMISSKLTQTDPKMAAMTYVMPVVLTFVFINLASGLVLYYTMSNVLTFVQQWWLKRGAASTGPAPPVPVKAKR